MKTLMRWALVAAIAFGAAAGVDAQSDDSILGKVKQFLTGPPPPPKKKTTSTKHSATSSPSTRSKSTKPKGSATPAKKRSPTPSPTPETSPSPTPEQTPERTPTPAETPSATPTPSESPSATPEETPTPTSTPKKKASPTPSVRPTASAAPTPVKSGTAPVSIASSEIAGYEKYPDDVRKVLDASLDLTTRNLNYKYGSADPVSGGMDCSGFVYYVLRQTGMKDVPRDAREQYIWVRKAGKFQAVLSHSPDTFELDALKPGDLLFWAGTYNIDRDPGITHVMIYLGREKATNQRIMVGSSDGRTYHNQSRFGVGVFDFKLAGRKTTSSNEPGPTFVGYASIPGIENASAITESARSKEHEAVVVPSPAHKSSKSKAHRTPKPSSRDENESDGSGER